MEPKVVEDIAKPQKHSLNFNNQFDTKQFNPKFDCF